jgi:hypothetical protein
MEMPRGHRGLTDGRAPGGPGLDVDPWLLDAIDAAKALGCDEWGYGVPVVNNNTGSTAFTDNAAEGGTLHRTANGFFYFPPQAIFQNPKASTKWYLKYRFRQSKAAAVGEGLLLGLYNSGANDGCWIGNDVTTGPPAVAGNWFAQISDGAANDTADTGVAVDTNFHDLELSHVGANVIFKLDGVQVASVTDAKLAVTPVSGVMVLTGITMKIRKVFWGFDGSAV